MGVSTFQQGAVVMIAGHRHTMARKISESVWQLEEQRTGRIKEFSNDELRGLYTKRQLTFETNAPERPTADLTRQRHAYLSEEQFEKAKVRRAYVVAILDLPTTAKMIAPVISETWNRIGKPPTPPNPVTVFRWRLKYIGSGKDLCSLVSNTGNRGNRALRYPKEVTDIVDGVIERVYLSREPGTIQEVLDQSILGVERENALRPESLRLPRPTRRLIARLIGTIPAFDKYSARHGHTAALNRFRSVRGHRTTKRPLERCEIDHTPLDLFVVDDESFLPLGRPYVTVCIDDFSRCILGIFVSFEPPSYRTVAACLRSAFLPKTDLQETYPNLKNLWAAHGVMRELVVDNGAEFHSQSFEQLCYSLGIEIHYAPRKTGWFKAKIERFLGSLNRGVSHGAPGTTFRNIFERGDYDPSRHSVIRLRTIQEIIRVWIVDYYHQKPHRSLRIPPAEAWNANIAPEDILVPDDLIWLDAVLGRTDSRRLSHRGIELDGLQYNSPELADLRRQLGDRLQVEIRINDADLGKITVFSPDKSRMFEVACLRPDYAAGLSRWQHRVCKRFAANNNGRPDPMGWLAAKETIARLIQQELSQKRRKSGARLARYQTTAATATPLTVGSAPPDQINATVAPAFEADVTPPSADSPPRPRRRLTPIIRPRVTDTLDHDEPPGGHDE